VQLSQPCHDSAHAAGGGQDIAEADVPGGEWRDRRQGQAGTVRVQREPEEAAEEFQLSGFHCRQGVIYCSMKTMFIITGPAGC
jgi:hypothetical protein